MNDGTHVTTNLTFLLDNEWAGAFSNSSDSDVDYNVLGYYNTSLPSGTHELVVSATSNSESSLLSVVIFDRMIYTFSQEDGAPSATSNTIAKSSGISAATTSSSIVASSSRGSPETGPLVGGIVGGVALLALVMTGPRLPMAAGTPVSVRAVQMPAQIRSAPCSTLLFAQNRG
ncbi:hypothetical protein DFH11DRAFT_1723016 [Phellopilus nigrolimitatus]|nr:hypothetical protein DFH11DRAFT_1723016 [Phellopilus nigrolimitatus]